MGRVNENLDDLEEDIKSLEIKEDDMESLRGSEQKHKVRYLLRRENTAFITCSVSTPLKKTISNTKLDKRTLSTLKIKAYKADLVSL